MVGEFEQIERTPALFFDLLTAYGQHSRMLAERLRDPLYQPSADLFLQKSTLGKIEALLRDATQRTSFG